MCKSGPNPSSSCSALILNCSTLSMTYGRPTMTTHLAPLPAPDGFDTSRPDGPSNWTLMAFYTEAIKLYGILDRILSDVYSAWRGRSRQGQSQSPTRSLGGLDVVLEIERQLTLFEANLPSFLKWNSGMHSDRGLGQAISQQRNVLHARYTPRPFRWYLSIAPDIYTDTCISTSFYTVLYSPSYTRNEYASASTQARATHKRARLLRTSQLGAPCTRRWLPSRQRPA